MILDKFCLLSGASVKYNDFITIYPPKLGDIRDIGYDRYKSNINIIMISSDDIRNILGISGEFEYSAIKAITLIPVLREEYLSSLSFFLHKQVVYDESIGYKLSDGDTRISFDELGEIKSIILQLCNIEQEENIAPKKFLDKRTQERYEKIQKLKKQKAERSKSFNKAFELYNLIGAVCAFSTSYNLTNIWDLTVCQFYDQFTRLNNKIQVDIVGLRWAAWGKDEFDFSTWYSPTEITK